MTTLTAVVSGLRPRSIRPARNTICRADDLIFEQTKYPAPPGPAPAGVRSAPPAPPRPTTPPAVPSVAYPANMPKRRGPNYGKLTRHDAPSPKVNPMRRASASPVPSRVGRMSRSDQPSERSVRAGRAASNPRYVRPSVSASAGSPVYASSSPDDTLTDEQAMNARLFQQGRPSSSADADTRGVQYLAGVGQGWASPPLSAPQR